MVREEDLRATFDALHGREAPVRAFDAADVIRQGERVRRNRRAFAVAGSGFATVAAVAAALFLLPTGEAPSAPVDPARPSSVRPTVPRTDEPASSVSPKNVSPTSVSPSRTVDQPTAQLSTTKPTESDTASATSPGSIPGSTSTTTTSTVESPSTVTTTRR